MSFDMREICITYKDVKEKQDFKEYEDENVFSILARANKLLQANGQGQEAKEMIARVQKSDNYYQALHIISEYVETELSEDFQKATKPPKKRGKEECR